MYKTRMCSNWINAGTCRNGDACSFAHGDAELQSVWTYFPEENGVQEHWVHRKNLRPDGTPVLKTEPPGDWVDVEQRRAAAGAKGFTSGMPNRPSLARPPAPPRANARGYVNNNSGGTAAAAAEEEGEEEWEDAMEDMTPCPWVEQPPSDGLQDHWLHSLTGEIVYDPPMVRVGREFWGQGGRRGNRYCFRASQLQRVQLCKCPVVLKKKKRNYGTSCVSSSSTAPPPQKRKN